MNNQHEESKRLRTRKKIIIGGAIILCAITVASSVSSFIIYRGGFADLPYILQQALALFAVIVVEGAFVWLVFGFTRAFTSAAERTICLAGMSGIVVVMLINLVTHFMMVKMIPLQPFQQMWVSWGAITVFIGVLVLVLCITLADPLTRIERLELRYMGKRDETIIQAKTDSLDSERIREALAERAQIEADELADKIVGRKALPPARSSNSRPGFQPAAEDRQRQIRGEHDDPNA